MIGLLAATSTPPPLPADSAGLALEDALLPTLPRLATRTVTPENAAATHAELLGLQTAHAGPTREKLVEVIYTPGTYVNLSPGQGMWLTRSSTGDPADVIFEKNNDDGGVLHWYGAPTWLRGVTLRTSTGAGVGTKYPLHMTGAGLLTVIDCNLEARNANSDGGPAIIGMDAGDNLDVSLVGCHLSNLGGIPSNIHGAGFGELGQRITFYDCTLSGADRTSIGFAGFDNERTDIWYIGGNITPGAHEGDVTNHVDNWPAPIGGFTSYQRLQWGIG